MIRSSLLVLASVNLIACGGVSSFGAPCGGGQFADAHAFLPNSGINAGDTIRVVFTQHDTQELTELVIWHLGPSAPGAIDPAPDPRVRIVADDGRVLLDSLGSRYNQPENRYNEPTWHVFTWVRDASLRNAVYWGLREQTLWI